MKASRRQKLRTNELAQSLADLIEFLKVNSGSVLIGVAAVVLVVGLGIYWYSAKVASGRRGWTDLYGSQLAPTPEARLNNLRAIASKYKDPALATSAWLTYGDASMQMAMSGARPTAERQRLLGEALNAYRTILSQYPDQVLAVAGARFKLAGLAEGGRRWDEARAQYQAIIGDPRFADLPHKQLAERAEKHLATLSQAVIFARPTTTVPTSQASAVPATIPATKAAAPRRPAKTQPSTKPTK